MLPVRSRPFSENICNVILENFPTAFPAVAYLVLSVYSTKIWNLPPVLSVVSFTRSKLTSFSFSFLIDSMPACFLIYDTNFSANSERNLPLRQPSALTTKLFRTLQLVVQKHYSLSLMFAFSLNCSHFFTNPLIEYETNTNLLF